MVCSYHYRTYKINAMLSSTLFSTLHQACEERKIAAQAPNFSIILSQPRIHCICHLYVIFESSELCPFDYILEIPANERSLE